MEVKTILSKIRQKEGQPSEYYFALEIGLEFVKSAVFSIVDSQIKVLSLGNTERWQAEEELIEAIDATLSSAAEKLPVEGEVQEPDKVVFGLPFSWVDGEKIVEDKLKLLKKVSEKLDLKPAGFVVIIEAIVHHLKTTEGIPPTAILVHLGLKKVDIGLARVGRISGPQLVDKSDNLADDLIEGLSRFETHEPLPARILIYDSEENLEEARQQLTTYPWLERKKAGVEFLHLPKVEVLPLDFDIQAIALAGGKEVVKAAGFILEEEPIEEEKKKEVKTEEGVKEAKETETVEEEAKEGIEKPVFIPAEDLGFIKGGDVAVESPESSLEESLGEPEVLEKPEELEPVEKSPLMGEPEMRTKQPVFARANFFSKITSFLGGFSGLKKFNLAFFRELMPASFRGSPILIIVLVLFLILAGSAFAGYWYLPRAKITLYLEPEILEKDFTVELDPTIGSPDKENFILPAQQVGEEVGGTQNRVTTGTKDIGDPAKGEVTIYNGTSNEKKFDANTVVSSTADLEFTLDDDVTVASQSSAADPPGKAVVKVTAIEIGTEGNLASGTEFTIANYAKSDYVAKNESAFSGGMSRQIQAVSKEDQEALLADLEAKLEKEAREKLISQLSPEDKLVEESISTKVVSSDYNHDVGEETDSLELALKVQAKALIYTEKELQELVKDSVLESVAEGFDYLPEETEFSFDLGEVNEEGKAIVEAHLKARLIPQQDLEQIRENLAGKYLPIGESYLNNLSRVAGFEVEITPRLPGRLGTFPRIAKRIEIITEIQ